MTFPNIVTTLRNKLKVGERPSLASYYTLTPSAPSSYILGPPVHVLPSPGVVEDNENEDAFIVALGHAIVLQQLKCIIVRPQVFYSHALRMWRLTFLLDLSRALCIFHVTAITNEALSQSAARVVKLFIMKSCAVRLRLSVRGEARNTHRLVYHCC